MAEPVCEIMVSPTKATPHGNLFLPGQMRSPHSFLDAPVLKLSAAGEVAVARLHDRVIELRAMGYDVEVTDGEDPLQLAIARGKESAKALKAEAKESEPPADESTTRKSGKAAKETA